MSREIEDENEETISKKRRKVEKKEKTSRFTVLENGIDSIIDSESEEEISDEKLQQLIESRKEERPKRSCATNKFFTYSEESDFEEDNDSVDKIPYTSNDNLIIKRPRVSELDENLKKAFKEFESDKLPLDDENLDDSLEQPPDIETNVVIAHSENLEPDKISIDIVSKSTDSKTSEDKVSLQLKTQGNNLLILIYNYYFKSFFTLNIVGTFYEFFF